MHSFIQQAAQIHIALYTVKKLLWLKSSNLKRHYESKHSKFERVYKQGTEEQKQKINHLKPQREMSTMILANMTTAQEKATECSLRIAWILGKHKKPFNDAEIVK